LLPPKCSTTFVGGPFIVPSEQIDLDYLTVLYSNLKINPIVVQSLTAKRLTAQGRRYRL
jgi:hypothetical protein